MSIQRAPYPSKGWVGRRGVTYFAHELLVGAAGAITTQDAQALSGVVATKQAGVGLYTYDLSNAFRKVVELSAEFIGALGAVTTGCVYSWINNNIDRGTKSGTIQLQWVRSDTNAIADVPNGTIVLVTIGVATGT